jgi:hypothetical protein
MENLLCFLKISDELMTGAKNFSFFISQSLIFQQFREWYENNMQGVVEIHGII